MNNIIIPQELYDFLSTNPPSEQLTEEKFLLYQNIIHGINDEKIRLSLTIRLAVLCEDLHLFQEAYDIILSSNELTCLNKLFLFGQLYSELFISSLSDNHSLLKKEYALFHQINNEFGSTFTDIEPLQAVNDNLVIVTIQQFLTLSHGPTKTILDRAYILQKNLGKRVIIINTAETEGGDEIPLCYTRYPSYISEYSNIGSFNYKDTAFEFIQFNQTTPSIDSTLVLMNIVMELRPQFIVNIGVYSLMVDLCNCLVPVLNINTVFSALAFMPRSYQAIGDSFRINDNTRELLDIIEQSENQILISRFTFPELTQTSSVSRNDLKLPDNSFLIAIVGCRLKDEMSDDFLDFLNEIASPTLHFVIIGEMESYTELSTTYPNFIANSSYLGFQKDVLSILENCDLYLNPPRKGGGTSVIEAMSKGLPAITLSWGDVSFSAGAEFCCNSIAEMKILIDKYTSDDAFYKSQSKKALNRAQSMFDTDKEFIETLNEFSKRAGIQL